MYGVGNPFLMSKEDWKAIHKTNKLVRKSTRTAEKNLKKIQKGKEYKSTQAEYDKVMNEVDNLIKKNEMEQKALETSKKVEEEHITETKECSKEYAALEMMRKNLATGIEVALAEALEREIERKRVSDAVISKILESKGTDAANGWAVLFASNTAWIIKKVDEYMTDLTKQLPKLDNDEDMCFANGYVKNIYGKEFGKVYPDSKTSILDISDIGNEKFDIESNNIFSFAEAKARVTEDVIKTAAQVFSDRQNNVVDVVNNPKMLPAPAMSNEEKLQEVVKELNLVAEEPVTIEKAESPYVPYSAEKSSNNIKYLYKYLTDILGADSEEAKSALFFEDKTNKFIYMQFNNGVFAIDPANIYGFGRWSIMGYTGNIVNGTMYSPVDTIMVPFEEKEIVKKIITNRYILSLVECEMIQRKYCFDNMLIYKYVDLSSTNTNKIIPMFSNIDEIKKLGKNLESLLSYTKGFRFRLANVESADKFTLVSDSFVLSPLASTGETAMPSMMPIELTSDMVKAAA